MEKAKKRYLLAGGILILFIAITGYGFVAAWGPCGERFSRSPKGDFHGRVFHHGLHDRDLADFFLWRMDRRVKELGLSAAQQEKYHDIRSIIETHITQGMEDRKRTLETLRREILDENPDIRLITGTLKERLEEMTGSIEETLDLVAEFYESLDDAQRDKILAEVRERMDVEK